MAEKIIKTKWSNLCNPYICGLLASNPSLYSATLHNTGYKILDLPFSYHPFRIQDLNTAIQAMIEMGFRGYSVTIPFKEDAIKFVDEISNSSNAIGAINTIVNDGNTLHGMNTDWIGIQKSIQELELSSINSKALIVGAGGAAKAAIYALQKMNVLDITITNRTLKRARDVAHDFEIKFIDSSKLNSKNFSSYNLIINATPQNKIDYLPYGSITKDQMIFEMITAETELTKAARKVEAKLATGIRMLLHQGLEQFKIFTEKNLLENQVEDELIKLYQSNNTK